MLTAHHLLLKDYSMDGKEGLSYLDVQRRILKAFHGLGYLVYLIFLLMLFMVEQLIWLFWDLVF
jgi:hypothetical protein